MESDTRLTNVQSNTLCTQMSCCLDDEDQYKLECVECKRLVHYMCTDLPLYQLQLLLTKNYRKFVCVNCVEVPDYLTKITPNLQIPASAIRSELESQIETSIKNKEEITKFWDEIDEHANTIKSYEVIEANLNCIITKQ